ncbi:MAG: hypothetical protein AAF291_03680 [Pseudomonadota bacterium]
MKRTLLASTLGFAALASAQTAQAQAAQAPCVNAEDAGDAVIYAMPIAYEAAMKSCKSALPDDSFLKSADGKQFIDTFRTKQDASWPGTIRMLKVFLANPGGEGGDQGMAQMLSSMDEDALRPFVDALGGQMLAEEIKPDTCNTINEAAELLSPLPVENVGGLVSLILKEVDLKEPSVCGVTGEVQVIPEGPLPAEAADGSNP